MNSNLAGLGLIMAVAGAAVGFYPISVLGVLVLIVSLMVPSRPPPQRQRAPAAEARGFGVGSARPVARVPFPQQLPKPAPAAFSPNPIQETTSSPALFPTTMFPSMSLATPQQTSAAEEKPAEKGESKDEVLELAALAVFLRLLSG